MKTISVFTKSGVTVTFKEDEVFSQVTNVVGIHDELTIDELYETLINCKHFNQEFHVKQILKHTVDDLETTITHNIYLPSEQISWFIMEEK